MSSYEDKIKMAVRIIEENLAGELHWRDISHKCAISEYHFHRIFTSLMKETPRDFIIRKRLEKAIGRLAYHSKEINLCEMAFDSGYSSQANFNKAFKSYFGVTPGQVLNGVHPENSKIGKIKSKYGKDFKIDHLYTDKKVNEDPIVKEVKVNAILKDLPERRVVFETSKGGYQKESIHETWVNFLAKFSTLKTPIAELEKFGIGHDNPQVTPMEKCRYDACVLIDGEDNIPPNLKQTVFPAGKYACFHYKGGPEKLLQLYLDIYQRWFLDNGYEPGNFPLIERYIFVDKDNLAADIELEAQFLLK